MIASMTWLEILVSGTAAFSGGALCLVLARFLFRPVKRNEGELPPLPPETADAAKAQLKEIEDENYYPDKRRSRRRRGKPIKVFVAIPGNVENATRGWVLDRSNNGLRLLVADKYYVGITLKLIPANSIDSMHWVEVVTRRCERRSEGWELGCEFKSNLPWSVLLRFG